MFWADSLGSNYVYSRLDSWSKTYGNFFKPSAYLAERASKGAPLVTIELVCFSTAVILHKYLASHITFDINAECSSRQCKGEITVSAIVFIPMQSLVDFGGK